MSFHYEIVPTTTEYYDLDLADAIQIAHERIEEWDYNQDPHGYCHERPVLIRLIEAARIVDAALVTEETPK